MRALFRRCQPAALLPALLLLAVGCSTPKHALRSSSDRTLLSTPLGQFEMRFSATDANVSDAMRIQAAVAAASPQLQRWGNLEATVSIDVLPSHEHLEEAVNRHGYGWLRAWARYDEVFLQAPRTWGLFGAQQAELDELLLHELTHCLMYQVASDKQSWSRKKIPLWFREGMASYTADQGYRWPTLEAIARFMDKHPQIDLVMAPEVLYQTDSDVVYGMAHHAFAFLVRRYGEEGVRHILAAMAEGRTFAPAFEVGIGLPLERFVRDFRHYVQWRGFRGSRSKHPLRLPGIPPENAPAPTPPTTAP